MGDTGPSAVVLFIVLLLADAFLYGFGAAVLHLNAKDVEGRTQEEEDKKSKYLLRIIREPDRYVNTVQVITTFINMFAGAYYLHLWIMWVNSAYSFPGSRLLGPFLGAIALLYIFLTFGVLLPKQIAVRFPEKWAYASIGIVWILMKLFIPLTGFVNVSVKTILFLFGMRHNQNVDDVTEEEIINIVQEGFEQGVIEDSEAEMINNILSYGDKETRDIMTHRSNIVAIEAGTPLEDAIAFMLSGINSRYPVYEDTIDNIVGVLHLKDACRYEKSHGGIGQPIKSLPGLIRDAYFVPQTKKIDELFEEMQSKKLHMAIVVDEYGQVDGLVAMEDILEEIVGNILDEYDEDTEFIEEKGINEYVIEGKTPLEELADLLNIDFEGEEFETLNGFMIYRLDHIPEPGEDFEVDYKGYHFKILSVENKMVQSVLVSKISALEENPK